MSKAEYNPPIGLLNKWQIAERYGDYKGIFGTDPSLEAIFDIIEKGTYFFDYGPGTFTRSTTGTYFDKSGALQVAAVDEPRFDYDTLTGYLKGLLIEKSSTVSNLDFDFTTWTNDRCTVIANATTIFSDKSYKATIDSLGTCRVYQAIVYTDAFFSVYVKPLSVDNKTIRIEQGGGNEGDFDLSDNSHSAGNGEYLEVLDDGWYRIGYKADNLGNNTQIIRFLNPTVGDEWLIALPQSELGESPSSPVINHGAGTVTRADDNALITGSSFSGIYNQDENTFLARFYKKDIDTYGEILSISDGTTDEQILVARNADNTISVSVNTGGVEQANISSNPDEGIVTIAFGFIENSLIVAINGSLIGTDEALSVPAVDQLQIGKDLNSTMNRIVSFPLMFTQDEIIKLSKN